jgi:hypothetical protein
MHLTVLTDRLGTKGMERLQCPSGVTTKKDFSQTGLFCSLLLLAGCKGGDERLQLHPQVGSHRQFSGIGSRGPEASCPRQEHRDLEVAAKKREEREVVT